MRGKAVVLLSAFEPSFVHRLHERAADLKGAGARVPLSSHPLIDDDELYVRIPRCSASIACLQEYIGQP